jgi:hypothetical protein
MHSVTNRPIHIAQGTELHLHGILGESFTQTISEATAASQVKLYYDRRSVGLSVSVSGNHLAPATNFLSSFL